MEDFQGKLIGDKRIYSLFPNQFTDLPIGRDKLVLEVMTTALQLQQLGREYTLGDPFEGLCLPL